jgi:hypothetical protein
MATLSLTYDTGSVSLTRIQDAIAAAYGYQATIPDGNGGTIPNPESKAQFARRMIGVHIKSVVRNQELAAARAASETSIAEITLT